MRGITTSPQGLAPAGSTLMMSARDLLRFAQAHVNDGVGENGAGILSTESAREMRRAGHRKGEAYCDPHGMGLGWMVADDGMVSHQGGGPGISAGLYVYPRSRFAAAVLTNEAHGGMALKLDLLERCSRNSGQTRRRAT